MCKKTKCWNTSGCGCCVQCYCNVSCYACFDAAVNFVTPGESMVWYGSADVRNKFVCFPCKRIWKSSVSKYDCQEALSVPSPSTKRNRNRTQLTKAYPIPIYRAATSKCAACRQPGIHVGRNFRHCRTDKEWKRMEQAIQQGTIDPINDFYDYPREGNGIHLVNQAKAKAKAEAKAEETI